MRFYQNGAYKEYTHIVAIAEFSNGNDSVGDMWLETKIFNKNVPVSEIIKWANGSGGKLIITIAEPEKGVKTWQVTETK